MRSHSFIARTAVVAWCVALAGCLQVSPDQEGRPRDVSDADRPPAPAECRPGAGERAYWFQFRGGPEGGDGPRMAELVVRHPAGVFPEVTGLEAARTAQKELHVRAKGDELTRVVLLASNNLLPLPSGPLACLRVPESAQLTFVRAQSEFAPARVEPEPDVIELWPVEVSP